MTDFRYTPFTVKMIRRHALTMTPATIAAFMRTTVGEIERICKKHEIPVRDGNAREMAREVASAWKKIEIAVDDAMLRVIKREAQQRGLDTHTLIERLIEKIAADGLFGAVLDR